VIDNQNLNQLLDEIEQDQPRAVQKPGGFQYPREPIVANSEAAGTYPAAKAKPQPHQPKGRLLVALVLLSILGFGGFQVWNSFFRFGAYGIVAANVVDVSAPIDGIVLSTHVREGAEVCQGQLIATLYDLDAQNRLERISDELRIAQANLSAEMARLHWQMQVQGLENEKSSAEYFEASARVEEEMARQKLFGNRLDRVRKLHERNATSHDEFEQMLYGHQGQTEKVSKLLEALESWRQRAATAETAGKLSMEQIEPLLVRIDSLKGELRRARESQKQGEVHSPVNGRINRWHMRAGEFARKSDGLFSVVEEGTAHARLYLPQRSLNRFAAGDVVDLQVLPFSRHVPFTVESIGGDLEAPPSEIKRYYSPDEKLLPIHLSLKNSSLESLGIPIGAQVRLPSNFFTD
jgi:multidrug resistance efflux pump